MTTTLLEPQQVNSLTGIGLHPSRRHGTDADAWKRAVGTKPIAARLEVLNSSKPRMDAMGTSAAVQVAILIFILSLPLFFPERIRMTLRYDIMPLLSTLETQVLLPPPPPPPPKLRPRIEKPKPIEQAAEPPKVAKLIAPKLVQPLPPKPKSIKVDTPDLKPVLEAAKLDVKTAEPKRPRDEVKVGNLATTGSAAPATVNLPLNKVQTGGFGDPNGAAGPGDPSKGANINRRGSPALPMGPGYGNGTGGADGVRGTVASTGFGNGIAIPPPSAGVKHGAVQASGFSDAAAAPVEAPKKKTVSSEEVTTIPVMLYKPQPVYSVEGRRLRIEGDVVLDVVILASGRVQVNRVVSGLGHGLDESAVSAASEMKFRPARHESQPVDYPARLRIEFRLAY